MGYTAATKLCPVRHPVTPSEWEQDTHATPARFSEQEREKLLLQHLPQVRLVARGIRDRLRLPVEVEDLIGYGVIGLMRAMERFDPSRGILLKTYAEHRIRGSILDGLRAMDWLSRTLRKKERIYRESVRAAEQLLGPQPSPPAPRAEIIYAGGNLEDIERMSQRAGLLDSLRAGPADPETLYERQELNRRLAQAIARLPQRGRQVIELYYQRELSMKQIGTILNVHESRVSQLHAAALERLRTFFPHPRRTAKGASAAKRFSGVRSRAARQPAGRKASKYRTAAARSASVSTPMVFSAVSTT